MKKEQVIELIKTNLAEIMPELEGTQININDPLVDIGANSIDRGELIALTLETLNLEVSRIEFAKAQTIDELADLVHKHVNQ